MEGLVRGGGGRGIYIRGVLSMSHLLYKKNDDGGNFV
jgi:hypothetical protein